MDEQGKDGSRLVRELYSGVNRKDATVFDRVASEGVEYVDFSSGETARGREAVKRYFGNWWTAFPDGTGEIKNLIESGDQVVVEILGKGKQTGPFESRIGRLEPSSHDFEFHFCQLFRVRDGKIVSGISYSDAFKLIEAHLEVRKAA